MEARQILVCCGCLLSNSGLKPGDGFDSLSLRLILESTMDSYKVSVSPYAMKVITEQALILKEIRASLPPMTDDEWKKWVMDRMEWEEIRR